MYSGATYGFNAPNRVAADGIHVWVTNPPGNSVTELDASDGSPVRILGGASYGFEYPAGIADDGTHVWVANAGGNSVTVLNPSDGTPVRVLAGASYDFVGPWGMAVEGHPHLGHQQRRQLGDRTERKMTSLGAWPHCRAGMRHTRTFAHSQG